MIYKLGDITGIQFGPYVKSKEETGVKYLSASHFDGYYELTKFMESESYIDLKTVENDLLVSGDIILAAKGQRFFAWEYKKSYGKCVASSLFYVIKTDTKIVSPSYLCLLLNTTKIKHQLELIGGSASVPSIPKKELMQLELNIPNKEKQEKTIAVANTLKENVTLTAKLLEKKIELKKGVIDKILNE